MGKKRKSKHDPVVTPPEPSDLPRLNPVRKREFDRDVERLKARGYDLTKLRTVVARLSKRQTLEPSYNDHALKGEWVGCRDCHVEPDWVLIYQPTETDLILLRTGTHSDLF